MEEQAAKLLATLRNTSVTVDAKLAQFNNLKSSIKHLRVPEASQAPIFECIKLAIGSQTSSSLVSTGFSTLGHFLKRLNVQSDTTIIATHGSKLFPILLDRLGDARESHRVAASQSLSDFWPHCHSEIERILRDGALAGNNSRAKEMAMQWVVKMSKIEGFHFRSYVPHLVASLEDPDGSVRETAKSAVVELFRNAPERAKADLKKQLSSHNVRKTIATHMLSQLGLGSNVDMDLNASTISVSTTATDNHRPESSLANSILSEHPPPTEIAPMDPIYVHTQRELDEIFRDMLPHFEGKETEQNWMARDKSITKLRRLTQGNAPTEFHTALMAGIKSLQDGIIKVANSLRTTMSTNGCQLVQELAKVLGSALDPMTEILLQSFIKMSAATKHISAQNGNLTVDTIFSNVSYNVRLMQHVWFAFQDKNVQPRVFASGWLKTLIKKHAHHKAQIEHTGGLELAEKCLKKGLADANPKVREGTRGTYWVFAQTWPEKAEAIMEELDAKSKQLLQKDPANPNASLASSTSSATSTLARSRGSGNAAPAINTARPSIREAVAAHRAQLTARRMPERPSSAQSTFSPVKQPSTTSLNGRAQQPVSSVRGGRPQTSASSSALVPPSGANGSGSLMSGPVRRPRRPELARPATADPYASRRAAKASSPTLSPANSPPKVTTSKKPVAGPSHAKTPSRTQIPTVSPVRSKSRMDQVVSREDPDVEVSQIDSTETSPSKDENTTTVMPSTNRIVESDTATVRNHKRSMIDKTMSVDTGIPSLMEDDGFTMVIPPMALHLFPAHQPVAHESPQKSATPWRSPLPKSSVDELSNTSPLQRLRSPVAKSPERRADSAHGMPGEEVKVYEDPITNEEPPPVPNVGSEKAVLEELPLNEKNIERRLSDDLLLTNGINGSTPQTSPARGTPNRHHKTTSTGSVIVNGSNEASLIEDSAEVLRARRLLASGIQRIRSKDLDTYGFRKVQDLVKSKQDIWGPQYEKFGDLLLALLDYLVAPPITSSSSAPKPTTTTTTPAKPPQNLKPQTLATIRAMLILHRKASVPYHPRALCAVLTARQHSDAASHLAADLEAAAEEIVRATPQPAQCLDAVLDLVDATAASAPVQYRHSSQNGVSLPQNPPEDPVRAGRARTTTMALRVLALLLQATSTTSSSSASSLAGSRDGGAAVGMLALAPQQTQRLGGLVVRLLNDVDPDVRKADLELCVEMHQCLGGGGGGGGAGSEKEGFWQAVVGAKEGQLNLIAYYLARRARA